MDVKKCVVTAGNVEVQSVFPRPVIVVPAKIHNPTKRAVKIDEVDFRVFLQDSYMGEGKIPAMVVKPGETREEKIPLKIPSWELLIPKIMSYLENDAMDARVEGNINCRTFMGIIKVPFVSRQTIKLKE